MVSTVKKQGGTLLKHVKKKLENQIQKLQRELREELPKALKKAIELGDLRENADYQAAKERQSYVQAELAMLRNRLAKLSMVDLSKLPRDKVSYGSTVVLRNRDTKKEVTYKLVSSEESDARRGAISTASPIGKTLMGHEEGDEIEIRTPRGNWQCKILKLTTLPEKK